MTVWYVAYGSNLLGARLRCYLEGGLAPGARWANPGARDATPSSADRRVDLVHPLVFGGPSRTWAGGPAFLDVERSGTSVGRGWRITHGQLEDVVAQENQLAPGAVRIDERVVRDGGEVVAGRYGRLVPLPPIDGEPAVTLTYRRRPTPRPPDPAYVSVIERGLRELGLAVAEARAALSAQPQLASARV